MRALFILGASILLLGTGFAQTPAARPLEPNPSDLAPLPPDSRTSGQIILQGRPVKYVAIAGSLPALDEMGVKRGDITFVAYLDSGDAASRERPVTFVFNGGPTASSLAMQLGLGPKRLPPRGSPPPPSLVDNTESWLDFTDLVFVDPVGTGWSRAIGSAAEAQKHFWGVQQDVDSLSGFVKDWIGKQRRWQSPIYLAGLSYGGFRMPKMAKALGALDVPLHGLVMLSPALDMASARGGEHPLSAVETLPSLAAAAIEKASGRDVDPSQLAEVENYAATEYAVDLLRGVNDRSAIERMSEKVARFTGLDPALVRRLGGRVDDATFRREIWRNEGKVGEVNDILMSEYDADPFSATPPEGPFYEGSIRVMAITDYVANELNWRVDAPYHERSLPAALSWEWLPGDSQGFPGWQTPGLDAATDLRGMLAANSGLKVLVAHGATDLNTPYMGSKLILAQIPDFGNQHRLQLKVYPGGHAFFLRRESSRHALHDDVRTMYRRRDVGE